MYIKNMCTAQEIDPVFSVNQPDEAKKTFFQEKNVERLVPPIHIWFGAEG